MNKAFFKIPKFFSVSNTVSYLEQGTFLHQNIEVF